MHEIKAPETILISQLQWDALMERLEELEDSLITLQAELDIATGKSQVVTIHDADEFLREMLGEYEQPTSPSRALPRAKPPRPARRGSPLPHRVG